MYCFWTSVYLQYQQDHDRLQTHYLEYHIFFTPSPKNVLKTSLNSSLNKYGDNGEGSFLCKALFNIRKRALGLCALFLMSSEKCLTQNIFNMELTLRSCLSQVPGYQGQPVG